MITEQMSLPHVPSDTSDPVDPAGPVQDFGCYITISNHAKQDLLLSCFGIDDGEWPLTQPVNTIKGGTSARVQLNDIAGFKGSQGWVEYEVRLNDKTEDFRIAFQCPYAFWNSNKVTHSASTDAISIKPGPYESSGHPLHCTVDVAVNGEGNIPTMAIEQPTGSRSASGASPTQDNSAVRANYDFGFKAPLGVFVTTPLHESIAISAFIYSKMPMPKATVPNNLSPEQWEYFRGLLWPDDPSCLIFKDQRDDNRDYGIGAAWLKAFKLGKSSSMTQRSHFGDLQFLHSMGSFVGEKPEVTLDKLLHWMGVMYRLALGQDGVSEQDSVTKHFPASVFGADWASVSLRDLLLAETPSYRYADLRRRALGVCLHMIQDSYAVGHVKRQLRNPGDVLSREGRDGFIHFRPGTHGDWGDILCFHTYRGQDGLRHKHYDGVPKGYRDPSPRDLSTFDPVIGARSAITGCLTLINFFADGTPWSQVRTTLEQGVYRLHPDAVPSDTDVDSLGLTNPTPSVVGCAAVEETADDDDVEYWAGHDRKLLAPGMSGAAASQGLWSNHQGVALRAGVARRRAIVFGFVMALVPSFCLGFILWQVR